MQIDILTLFPEFFPGPLGGSIVGRAQKNGIVEIRAIDLRQYTHDRHATVDDKPYGGGPGMLMRVEPLFEAVEALRTPETTVILTTPRGRQFEQAAARELSVKKHLLIICGHYEGVDQRAIDQLVDLELSIGDYVLTSGNLAAMVIADAVTRLLPGALGSDESSEDESFSTELLEYPQYTRPEEYRNLRVPEVLLAGDHAAVAKWRLSEAEKITKERRPDRYYRYKLKADSF